MENNTQNADTLILDKKLNNYGRNDDFVAPKELTVTITLAEYRTLVSSNAKSTSDYDKLQTEKWKLESENKRLKETIEAIKPYPIGLRTEPADTKQTED
ncbi:MAG: hypothetical protein II265_01475 [Clostridia bacterium]|nr:hypothetical protein [Clostridia bacterium]